MARILPQRLIGALAMLYAAGALAAPPASWEQPERARLDQLCAAGRFDEAERRCVAALADPALDEAKRLFYTIERSRCLSRRALVSPADQAPRYWRQALSALESGYGSRSPGAALTIDLQSGLVRLRWGESDALFGGDGAREESLELLRGAAKQLAQVVADSRAPELRSPRGLLRADEVRGLANQAALHEARAYRLLAELYPAESPDRADALNRAVDAIRELAGLPADQQIGLEARLELARGLRLQGDLSGARKQLAALADAPPQLASLANAEFIRIALAENDLAGALAMVDKYVAPAGHNAPEFDEAALRAIVDSWRESERARDTDAAKKLKERATAQIELIRKAHGGHWHARAERMLSSAVEADASVSDLALLEQSARTLYQAGKIDESVAAYERASRAAEAAANLEKAFEWAFVAATLEHQRQSYDAAAQRYRALALSWPNLPRAAEAHLLAAHDRYEATREANLPDDGPYAQLLREHLRLWPKSPTASEARFRLGRVAETQKDWPAAIDAYRAIDPNHARAEEAIHALVRAYEQWLSGDAENANAPRSLRDSANFLEGMSGEARNVPEPVRAAAAIGAARLWIHAPDEGLAAATRTLDAYLSRDGVADELRERVADERLLIGVEQLGATEISEQLDRVGALPAESLFRALRALALISPDTTEPESRKRAEFLLAVLERGQARLTALPAEQSRQARIWQAEALARLGRAEEARESFAQVASASPADREAAIGYARSFAANGSPESHRLALDAWRKVESLERRGTPGWAAARVQVARQQVALGEAEQARKILRQLVLLHSKALDDSLRAEIEQLEQAIGTK